MPLPSEFGPLFRRIAEGVLDRLPCPSCAELSVALYFTASPPGMFRQPRYGTWAACPECGFETHLNNGNERPASFTEARVKPKYQAKDEQTWRGLMRSGLAKDWGWGLLRAGEIGDGLGLFAKACAHLGNMSHAMELGVAYLWVGEYDAAWKHFCSFNETYPHHADCTYAMAGAAKWCLNQPAEAVYHWRDGLECQYTDPVRADLPLLLLFASVAGSGVFSTSEAKKLLRSRVDRPPSQNWPLPLVQFVLGRIGEEELRKACSGRVRPRGVISTWDCGRAWKLIMTNTRN